MIKIKDLFVSTGGQEILKGINLEIKKGEVHAIMGPNGSGKSTLSKVIAGHPAYEITSGEITFLHNNKEVVINAMEPEERAKMGMFLSFQYPIEIPGVTNFNFLQESYQQVCLAQGVKPLSEKDFLTLLSEKTKTLQMSEAFLHRPINEGFSGGEKKKNEILQLMLLNPRLAILDETDSGLDIDALKTVADGVNLFKSKYNSVILITHYQRLLNYIQPDFVHILFQGKIVKSGDKTLALKLEAEGYDWVKK